MMLLDEARLRLARGLEAGAWDGATSRALSSAWSAVAARGLARPLVWPAHVRVIAIGGATLGGSGKTPLAIACARALAQRGARVAFVAHGYRASPGESRVARADDPLHVVGDEALVASRALVGSAPVVVAKSRQAAIDHASRLADVLVLDGVLQTAPRRATRSLLALDPDAPWGAGHVPPRGDLRASRRDLLSACDEIVPLRYASRGAHLADRLLTYPEIAPLRVGLFVALARPSRIVASLARHGVTPAVVLASSDHVAPSAALVRRIASAPVDLWLASAKCGLHLEAARIPHATLDHDVILDESWTQALMRALP